VAIAWIEPAGCRTLGLGDLTLTSVRPAIAVFALAAVASLAVWRSAPPRPRGADAPRAEFSAARAEEVLRRLVGEEAPRPLGSAEHRRFRERLVAELSRLSLASSLERGVACSPNGSCAQLTNVLAELPGTLQGPAVLLVAHYDSVAAGPGVSDNAAGVACALEVARALQSSPRRNPVLLLFDDGEEAGLLGAELFMASERSRSIGAVVNLEARGTSGASFLFETSRDNAWLVRRAAGRMPRPVTSSVFSFVYDRLPNDTDLTVFKRAGLPGLNLAFIGSAARYHTPQDSLANLSRASLQHHGDNALALVRALADEDLPAAHAGDAVFFDLAGLAVLWWPKGLTPVIALFGLALVRVAAGRRGGRPLPRVKVLLPFLAPLLGLVAGALVWQILRLAGAFPVSFIAHPVPAILAVSAAAVAATLLVLAVESRWTGSPAEVWERIWTSSALLGLVLAVTVPELSFLLVVPTFAAGISRLVLPEAISAWVPFTLLGLLILPLALRMPEALGPVGLPLVAVGLGLTLASLPVHSTRGATRRPVFLLVGLCLAASAAVLLAPASTPRDPEHGSIVAAEGEGEAGATLIFRPESGRLPESVARAAPFERRSAVLPWARPAPAFVAPLPPLELPHPTLEVLGEEAGLDGRRRLTLRLSSPRGAPEIGLAFAGAVPAGSIRVQGQPLAPPYLRGRSSHNGISLVSFEAAPPEGVVVELTLSADRLDAFVLDRSPGLPASAQATATSRPATHVPALGGDATVLYRRVIL
jgi:hypothetical protein